MANFGVPLGVLGLQYRRETGSFSGGSYVPPVLLDLDGNGIAITERSKSSVYLDGGDGKQHRTAWAGAGDGVLFFDAGLDGKITERREFVFTEWTDGSTSDLEALREAFDTSGDGKLTAADAQWASFKVMVTLADGTTQARTLGELGITEIDLKPDATHIELPDGSVITGKTTFVRNGETRTVADTTLSMDADGHRVVRTESVLTGRADGFTRQITNAGYDEDGKLAFKQVTLSKADGSQTRHTFDDNGDGVADRRQDIKVSVNATTGVRTETVTNRVNDDADDTTSFSVTDRTRTVTSADGRSVTIFRDTNGGGAFEVKETQVTTGSLVNVTIEQLAPDGVTVIDRVTRVASNNGLTRVEAHDGDGAGASAALKVSHGIADAAGVRTETIEAQDSTGRAYARTVEVTSANGLSDTTTQWIDRDGNGTLDVVSRETVVVADGVAGAKVTTTEVRNADGTLAERGVGTVSADARDRLVATDLDGDGDVDVTARDATEVTAGVRIQTVTETHADGSGNSGRRTVLQADGVTAKTWSDLNGDGQFDASELIRDVSVGAGGARTEMAWTRAGDGVIVGKSTSVTSEDGRVRDRVIDLDGDGDVDRVVHDETSVNGQTGVAIRTVETRAEDGTFLSRTVTTSSADGLQKGVVTTTAGADQSIVTKSQLATTQLANGDTRETDSEYSGNGGLTQRRIVTQSENRQTTTTEVDSNGDGQVDSRTVETRAANGTVATTTQTLAIGAAAGNAVEIAKTVETVSRNGQDVWTRQDLDGDNDFDVKTHRDAVVGADGSVTTTTLIQSRDGGDVTASKSIVSADGLTRQSFQNLDMSTTAIERSTRLETRIDANGTRVTTEKVFAGGNTTTGPLLTQEQTAASDDGLRTVTLSNTDGIGGYDQISVSQTVLSNDGSGRRTTTQSGLVGTANGLGTVFVTTDDVVKDKGRTTSHRVDVNGDGRFDTIMNRTVAATGIKTETRVEQDQAGDAMWTSTKVTSANGLRSVTTLDQDGDGVVDASTVEQTTAIADGSSRKTISHYGRVIDPTYDDNGTDTLNSRTTMTTRAGGRWVIADQDLDGDGTVDLRTITVATVEATGDKVTTVTRNTGTGTTKIGQDVTTTSRTGRSVTVESDLDGNGQNDLVRQSKINADGTKTDTVTYLSSGGVRVAGTVAIASANGFETLTRKDLNGDGDTDLTIRQVKVLENDGDVRTSTTIDSARNERLGGVTETRSMDGLHSSVALDWDGRDGVDFTSQTDRTFKANGDVVDTMITLDGVSTIRSTIVSTTSGNGLERYVTTDFDGDGSIDRILDSKTAASGSRVVTTTEFSPGLDTRRETIVAISANGRDTTTTIDKNGDGYIDRQSVSHVDSNRTTRTVHSEVLLNGDAGDRIVETTSFNGAVHRFQFDVGGGDAPEFTRETIVGYGTAGQRVTTFTESYGDRAVYVTKTTASQNRLHSRIDIDADGDGTTDAVTRTDTTINGSGSRTTTSQTVYTQEFDNDVQSKSVVWVSGDGRVTRTWLDYDGNGIDDATSVQRVGSDGTRVLTERSFDKAGGALGEIVTETSADGLLTMINQQGDRQVIIRSAVGGGSYVWKGGTEIGQEKIVVTPTPGPTGIGRSSDEDDVRDVRAYTTYVRSLTTKQVSHQVDAFGIETWGFIERQTVGGVVTSTTDHERLDPEAKARILAEAARVYDAALDRQMSTAEAETLVRYVDDGQLKRGDLAHDLLVSVEYNIRYGSMDAAEFINQVYHNTLGRGATLAEASDVLASLASGQTRTSVVWTLAEAIEHGIVGNGHMRTNNYNVVLNPVLFDRSLDRAFVQEQITRLVDIVYDRKATDAELSVLSGKLMGGSETLGDIAQLLLDTEGRLSGGRVSAIDATMSSRAFVRNAFENAYGRLPTETEERRWVDTLDANRLSKAGFVLLLANSGDHLADGNGSMPGAATEAWRVQNGTNTSDSLTGTSTQDELRGLEGADKLTGGDGADRLVGGEGSDSLVGGRGNDRYYWLKGDGNDTIDDADGSQITTDTLVLRDALPGEIDLERSGSNLLVRIGGSTITVKDRFLDTARGLGIEAIQFGDGTQWDLRRILSETRSRGVEGSDYRDNLRGGDGADTIYGLHGRDTIAGGKGNDLLFGGAGGDRYLWARGDGNETITEGGDTAGTIDVLDLSTIKASDVNDVKRINDTRDIQIVIGGAGGGTIIVKGQFNDAWVGGGIERILFSDGVWTLDDIIHKSNFNGGSTGTALTGSNYDDLITGGGGNDTISSGVGNDTLLGEVGDDLLQGGVGSDLYRWSRGHGADTINDRGNGGEGTDELMLTDVRSDDISLGRVNNSEDLQIRIWTGADVTTVITDQGFFSDSVAGQGVDRIRLSDGVVWDRADILDRAKVYGGSGAATLNGTRYRDHLSGLGGNDVLNGKDGADTLVGGDGGDVLNGGDGSDTYIWQAGPLQGNDVIRDLSDHAGDVDTLRLKGVASNDVQLVLDGEDLLLKVSANGSVPISRTIRDVDRFDAMGAGGIEVIEFDDGERIRVRNSKVAIVEYTGTAAADSQQGWYYGDLMFGGRGADSLYGGAGGSDTLVGGAGDDWLNGHTGTDVYRWATGHGDDTINDTGTAVTEADRLELDIGDLTQADVSLRRSSSSHTLRIAISGGGVTETISVLAQYADGSTGQGIEAIRLSDGTVWTLDDILAQTQTLGTSGRDTLEGTRYRDNIRGGAGADRLSGYDGGDHLYGGADNDILVGGAGSDTYHWAVGDGEDTINDGGATTEQSDLLAFATISSTFAEGATVYLRRNTTELWVNVVKAGVTETIVVENQFGGTAAGLGIEGLQFSDGVVWTLDDILEKTRWVTADFATTVEGTTFRDNIYGRGGDDLLLGNGGGDHLFGGAGADTLDGASGSDWYHWSTGDESDWVRDLNENDVQVDVVELDGAGGVVLLRDQDAANLIYRDDLIIRFYVDGAWQGIRVIDQFADLGSGRGIERIITDTLDLSLGEILARAKANGTEAADTINGTDFLDNLYGYGGADALYGKYGQDVLYGGLGADTLDGGTGDDDASYALSDLAVDVDLMRAGAQIGAPAGSESNGDRLIDIEGLVGSSGNDALAGDDQSNTLAGGGGNDALSGRSGFDRLYGGDGNDRLYGGDGADVLTGGDGADRFVFVENTGEDTIVGFDGQEGDRIQFTGSPTAAGAFQFLGARAFTGGGDNAEARLVGDRVLIDYDGDTTADIWITIGDSAASALVAGHFAVL